MRVVISELICFKVVGKHGGEDLLARWPNVRGMRSVEDAFTDILKYLTSVWDGLSTAGLSFEPIS